MGLYTTIGASVGLGLGLFLSLRLRRASYSIYNAAKKVEQPTALQFADGHTGGCTGMCSMRRDAAWEEILRQDPRSASS